MAKQIATVSTVFAACDRLDAANDRWNREDVRNEVGGGGYVVIDPLIRAWRALKPLREVAPCTPAELLHQVAVSIDAHITDFTQRTDARLAESQKVFESTVLELSEKLAALEVELAGERETLRELESSNHALAEQLDEKREALNDAQTENARRVTENDGLRGQVARMEKEYKAALQSLQAENKDLIKQHAQERIRLGDEHAAALAAQRKELAELAEQAENRLMVLLDQERQDAKATESKLSGNLEKVTQKAKSLRESIIALESKVTELARRNEKLDSELATRVESNLALQASLEEQKAATALIEHAFTAYKRQHILGGELGALQDAVAGLQAQLTERHKKMKE